MNLEQEIRKLRKLTLQIAYDYPNINNCGLLECLYAIESFYEGICLANKDLHKEIDSMKEMLQNKVYVVVRNADMAEGRGPMVFDSVFTRKEAAQAYVDKYGLSEQFRKVIEAVLINRHASELNEILNDLEREKALNKLTQKERELLGL